MSKEIFKNVVKKRQKRSRFDLSHDVKLSLDMGLCVPVLVMDTIPGDSIKINSSSMLRMAPLVSPVMHKIDVFMEYFFVPNRILWQNWETFITGSRNGKQLTAVEIPAFPYVNPFQNANFTNEPGSLSDYLGIPTPNDFDPLEEPSNSIALSAMPFAAYQRIWDEYYRDQNMVTSIYDVDPEEWENYNMLPDGQCSIPIHQQLSGIRPRAWEHDYFTSALPWAQKGEIVSIPVDTTGLTIEGGLSYSNVSPTYMISTGGTPAVNDPLVASTATAQSRIKAKDGTGPYVNINNVGNIIPNFTIENSGEAAGMTINDLRAAIKLQEWLETNARGGSRYFESIYAHFGVKSPDSRLQRPEFIGSNRSHMVISEVLQSSSPQSETDTPQGNMSGHGSSVGSTRNFKYYCQEHGYIIGIMSVMPKTAYQQGIPKHFMKTGDRLDFYFPEFAHLGEQEILGMEVYAGGDIETATEVFGYIPRYSEYKFINSRVCGDFRDTLKFWHMGRVFDSAPALNDTFIGSDPTKRIFAVQDLPDDGSGSAGSIRNYHSLYAHVYHDIKASRLMPKYGTPTL